MELPVLSVGGVEVKLSTYENAQIVMEDGQVRVSLENYSGDLLFMTSVSLQKLALPVARPRKQWPINVAARMIRSPSIPMVRTAVLSTINVGGAFCRPSLMDSTILWPVGEREVGHTFKLSPSHPLSPLRSSIPWHRVLRAKTRGRQRATRELSR
jgi:hypothetical protein